MKRYTIRTRTFGPREIDKGLTVVLTAGDVIRLPGRTTVRLLAGKVWITDRGRDILLGKNQEHCGDPRSAAIMLSNISQQPATVLVILSATEGCEESATD